MGPRQRGRGQGVGHGVGRDRAATGLLEVGERPQLGGGRAPLGHERAVAEHVVHDTEHRQAGDPERETDGAAPVDHVGVADHLLGRGVGDVVDARDLGALVHLRLGRGVRLDRAVPVDVVGCQIEARASTGCQ